MKKAVMYGGGNIGRGFVGPIFSRAGYEVTFVNTRAQVIDEINARGEYPVRLVNNSGYTEETVKNVSSVNGGNIEETSETIAECDIMATAVGARVLGLIVPNIVAGMRKRWARTEKPLNIIICENLNDANKILEGMILEQLTEEEKPLFYERVGLVETSIGRMVPVQTDEMKNGDNLRICTERYPFLPVDKAAFKGEVPEIQNMIPFEPFDFYLKRKLYIHNMGHSVCAYLGGINGKEYIFEAIDDSEILNITQNAMLESAMAMSKEYSMPLDGILLHMQDLIARFGNILLKDTCDRVGADPARKLGPTDRLIGSSLLCLKHGITPAYITVGAAGAVYRYLKENGPEQSMNEAKKVLKEVSGLEADSELAKLILANYEKLLDGAKTEELRRNAQNVKYQSLGNVI